MNNRKSKTDINVEELLNNIDEQKKIHEGITSSEEQLKIISEQIEEVQRFRILFNEQIKTLTVILEQAREIPQEIKNCIESAQGSKYQVELDKDSLHSLNELYSNYFVLNKEIIDENFNAINKLHGEIKKKTEVVEDYIRKTDGQIIIPRYTWSYLVVIFLGYFILFGTSFFFNYTKDTNREMTLFMLASLLLFFLTELTKKAVTFLKKKKEGNVFRIGFLRTFYFICLAEISSFWVFAFMDDYNVNNIHLMLWMFPLLLLGNFIQVIVKLFLNVRKKIIAKQ